MGPLKVPYFYFKSSNTIRADLLEEAQEAGDSIYSLVHNLLKTCFYFSLLLKPMLRTSFPHGKASSPGKGRAFIVGKHL